MSAFTERITEVLRAHFPQELAYEARCSCGQRFEYDQDGGFEWAAHVAERIEAELHLWTEAVHVEGEWGFGARDEIRVRGTL